MNIINSRGGVGTPPTPPLATGLSCDGNWWLACVLEVCSDTKEVTKEVKLTFLHPYGPANSFKYPTPHNIHTNSCRPKNKKRSCLFSDLKRNDCC